MLGLQNEREWQAVLRAACSSSRRSPPTRASPRNAARTRGARGAARDHRRGLRGAQRGAGRRAPRRGADRQRARQHDGRRLGASAAAARGAGSRSRRRPARCRRCCRRARATPATRAWTPCRRSARTPTRCSPRSASTPRRSSACAARARSDAHRVPHASPCAATRSRRSPARTCATSACSRRRSTRSAPTSTAASSFSASTTRSAAMAEALLAAASGRFTPIGLSLGGYVAFEVMRRGAGARRAPGAARHDRRRPTRETRRAGRLADIATVEAGGIEALIPAAARRAGCCRRTQRPRRPDRADGVAWPASIGARRADATSSARCSAGPIRSPTSPPCACRRWCSAARGDRGHAASPITRRSRRASPARGSSSFAESGHLSTIEQPAAVTACCRSGSRRPAPERAAARPEDAYSTALTMSSTTFLASPKTIIVLSM